MSFLFIKEQNEKRTQIPDTKFEKTKTNNRNFNVFKMSSKYLRMEVSIPQITADCENEIQAQQIHCYLEAFFCLSKW